MKKKVIAYICEILYLAVLFGYMLVIKNAYSQALVPDMHAFLALSLLVLGILALIGPTASKFFGLILVGAFALYPIAQTVYHSAFDDYFRLRQYFGLQSEVHGVMSSVTSLIRFEHVFPLLILLGIIILFIIIRFTLQKKEHLWLLKIMAAVLLLLSFVNYRALHEDVRDKENSDQFVKIFTDEYLYYDIPSSTSFIERLGLMTYEVRDYELLFEKKAVHKEDVPDIENYLNSTDKDPRTNEYAGLLKGRSLLVVQAESLIYGGIDEELTPNLYHYLRDGISFTGFSTPLLPASTSDTEIMTNLSMIPVASRYAACYDYADNTFPQTLATVFANAGYTANAYHANYGSYYNRLEVFPKLGYQFFDMKEFGEGEVKEDSYIVEKLAWISVEQEKFLAYWITYNGHQPYVFGDIGVKEEDVQRIRQKYPELDEEHTAYFAKNMDLDRSLETFFRIMEWMGRADDVAVVIFGDHHTKGLDFSKGGNYDTVVHRNANDDPTLLMTPLMIYSRDMESGIQIDTAGTALDLLPTIANLFGISYDSSLTLGNDLLDPYAAHYRFDVNRNVASKDFTYDPATNEVTLLNGNITKEEAEYIVSSYRTVYDISMKILRSDYFAEKGS